MWEPLLGFYRHHVMLRVEQRQAKSAAGWVVTENVFPTVALATTLFNLIILHTIRIDLKKHVIKANMKGTMLGGNPIYCNAIDLDQLCDVSIQ